MTASGACRPWRSPRTRPAARRSRCGAFLVIVDALAARNIDDWSLPTPSAFTAGEQQSLISWVRGGGALLVAADHMPFAGAASELSERLGLEVLNGFAIDTASWDPITFRRSDGTLRPHPIVDADGSATRIDSVFTYWGHAFRPRGGGAVPLLVFPKGTVSYQPRRAWRFDEDTEIRDVDGWAEGVALHVGRGRVVVLGDSGLLMAHLVGPKRRPIGMNAPEGEQNAAFMRNVFRWLAGATP